MQPFTEVEMYELVKKFVELPVGQICVHLAAADILSLMEEKGAKLDNDTVRAIVRAEDEISLPLLTAKIEELKTAS